MEISDLLERSAPYLSQAGFELTEKRTTRSDGRPLPFGDQQWVFTAQGLDLEIVRDRGQVWVGLGLDGQPTFGYQPWALAVGIPFEADLPLLGQVEFFTLHLAEMVMFIQSHSDPMSLVRAENWKLTAPLIGQDPNLPPPGSSGVSGA